MQGVLKPNNDNDGVFWMSWDDFRRVWDEITVCARSTDASDLSFDVHEELGCVGELIYVIVRSIDCLIDS